MLDAIENEEKKFKEKFIYLEKIDIRNKSDNTLRAYKAIFKSLKRFFGNDYDVNDLNYKMVDEYASQFKNDTYINHLKSIFDRYISKNNLESEDLLDIETNIEMSAKIYRYGVEQCSKTYKEGTKELVECSLSMYNTGKMSKNSKIGKEYANKVILVKNSL